MSNINNSRRSSRSISSPSPQAKRPKMTTPIKKADGAEPQFITYLMSPDVDHDTYFLIGNERIGAVKKMLIAHSVVLRCELQTRKLAEKGEITLEDLCSSTFRNLLKYVYGYNKISSLTFDEADDLLYAADRYMMKSLKDQLALRLMDLLNPHNICSLLNNPACHTVLELDAAITEILQMETDKVFASTDFLYLRTEGFVKILEQDALCAQEMEIWRAALKWSKHKAGSEEGNVLRKHLDELKHIRIRCLEFEDICKEVVPTNVLSPIEIKEIVLAHGKGENPPAIKGFSDEILSRWRFHQNELNISVYSYEQSTTTSLTIKTTCGIKLLPLEFTANTSSSRVYRCNCTIEVVHVSILQNRPLNPRITVTYNEAVESGTVFTVPFTHHGGYVRLSPNSTYTLNVTFSEPHQHWITSQPSFSNKDLSFQSNTLTYTYSGYPSYKLFPCKSLKYLCCKTK